MFGKAAQVTVLRHTAIFSTGLICATLILERATAADLRIPVNPNSSNPRVQVTPAAAPNGARLYQEFLKWLETHPR